MNPAEITNVSTNPCMLSCGQCDYVATRSDNLKMHIKNKHDLVRYPCDLCDYKSTRESDLRRHKKTVHKLQGILSGTFLIILKWYGSVFFFSDLLFLFEIPL